MHQRHQELILQLVIQKLHEFHQVVFDLRSGSLELGRYPVGPIEPTTYLGLSAYSAQTSDATVKQFFY